MKQHHGFTFFAFGVISFLSVFSDQSYGQIPTSGLVAYYPFSGNANDSSGNGNNGTVYNATLTTDRFGNSNSAYSFNGTNAYIKASASGLPTCDRTVSIWMKLNRVDNKPVVIGYGGGTCGTSWIQGVNIEGRGAYEVTGHCGAGTLPGYYSGDPSGSWKNYVITNDYTHNTTHIYVNNVQVTFSYTALNTAVTATDLAIGVAVNSAGVAPYTDANLGYTDGALDDIRIYNRILDASEIQALYNESNPLPVELTSIIASADRNHISIKWRTATEVNNYGFDVEKRTVNSNQSSENSWSKIGFVQGNGTSNAPHEYTFADQTITVGTYAYRLKQIDDGGNFKYTQETEMEISAPQFFALSQNYPNPFNPTTTISFSLPLKSLVSLKVFDVLGREVTTILSKEMSAGSYLEQWNAANMVSGIYFCRLQAGSFIETKKLVLLR